MMPAERFCMYIFKYKLYQTDRTISNKSAGTNAMDTLGDSSFQTGMVPFESNNFLLHTVDISVLSSISFSDKKITFLYLVVLPLVFDASRKWFIPAVQVTVLWGQQHYGMQ